MNIKLRIEVISMSKLISYHYCYLTISLHYFSMLFGSYLAEEYFEIFLGFVGNFYFRLVLVFLVSFSLVLFRLK